MLSIEHEQDHVRVSAAGDFNLSDYRQLEENLLYAFKFQGQIDLLLDLRAMQHFTIDMALEELRFSRAHHESYRRIAVVSDNPWVALGSWVTALFAETETQVFNDLADAELWLRQTSDDEQALA